MSALHLDQDVIVRNEWLGTVVGLDVEAPFAEDGDWRGVAVKDLAGDVYVWPYEAVEPAGEQP